MMTSSLVLLAFFAADAATIAEAKKDEHGFLVHEVRSPLQAGKTHIRVLLPEKREEGKRYPVVYVLPVEPGTESRFGDGLLEVKKQDLHNKHSAIFVMPSFFHLPWYADHATKEDLRQESYFLQVVVPHIDKTYPAARGGAREIAPGLQQIGLGRVQPAAAPSGLLRPGVGLGRCRLP